MPPRQALESHNPATGELLATVAEGEAEDINRAVAAARRAFEGPWSKVKPFERQALLLNSPISSRRNLGTVGLDTLDMGLPISPHPRQPARMIGMLRFYAGLATALHGEPSRIRSPAKSSPTPEGADGHRRRDRAMERAARRCVWKIAPALATGCTMVLNPPKKRR